MSMMMPMNMSPSMRRDRRAPQQPSAFAPHHGQSTTALRRFPPQAAMDSHLWGDAPASTEHKPILADRFRTKMCRNFAETGECPYFHRCMFAHGEADLRTKQENVRDGLFSEDAIRAFKRAAYLRSLNDMTPSESSADEVQVAELPSVSPIVRRVGPYRHDPYAVKSVWHPLGRSHGASGTSTPRSL